MSKIFLLFCLLSLICLSQACRVTYWKKSPSKRCNGDLCFRLNAPATHITLSANNSLLKRSNFSVNEIHLDSICRCTFSLYTSTNYKGRTSSFKYLTSSVKSIFPNRIWKNKSKSFKLQCKFEV